MNRYALVDGKRQEVTGKKQYGICEGCGSKMIGRFGSIKVPHWSHESSDECDKWHEPKTQWHIKWQDKFPKDCQEKIVKDENGKYHIADVVIGNLVIEFQHSPISIGEIIERSEFYRKNVGNIFWVFDRDTDENNNVKNFFIKPFIDRESGLKFSSYEWKYKSGKYKIMIDEKIPYSIDCYDGESIFIILDDLYGATIRSLKTLAVNFNEYYKYESALSDRYKRLEKERLEKERIERERLEKIEKECKSERERITIEKLEIEKERNERIEGLENIEKEKELEIIKIKKLYPERFEKINLENSLYLSPAQLLEDRDRLLYKTDKPDIDRIIEIESAVHELAFNQEGYLIEPKMKSFQIIRKDSVKNSLTNFCKVIGEIQLKNRLAPGEPDNEPYPENIEEISKEICGF